MTGTIVLAFLGLFYADNHEYFDKVKEQVKKGYTWEYVGRTSWHENKSPSLIIRDSDGKNPHIYWKLTKPEDK